MKIWWDDGTWAVIEGKDCPRGVARSKTNDTWADAVRSNSWDPAMAAVPLGPKSQNKFVKVKMADLNHVANATPQVNLADLRPSNYGGSSSRKSIPDYPHRCLVCGGRTIDLFTSTEHEGGVCPGAPKKVKLRA